MQTRFIAFLKVEMQMSEKVTPVTVGGKYPLSPKPKVFVIHLLRKDTQTCVIVAS